MSKRKEIMLKCKKADTQKCGSSHPGRHSYGLGPAG